ncbi:MAG: glycosyltransferase family 4 protein [Acidimicrobiales bacterium]
MQRSAALSDASAPEAPSALAVALVGPDITGGAPGGMASISVDLIEAFEARGHIKLVPVSNFVEGSLWQRTAAALGSMWRVWCGRRSFDLVHVQVATGLSVERDLALWAVARAARLPVVLQFHGAGQIDDYRRSSKLQQALYRLLVSVSRCNMALGQATGDWLGSLAPGTPSAVVANFVPDPGPPPPLPPEPSLLFAGRLGERKGVLDLLAALASLAEEGIRPRVSLVGDGDVDAVRSAVEKGGASLGHVDVLGWRPRDEVWKLLADAWALVLPSYGEGLPMAVLEAMAFGRAVIATPVGEVADAVGDGRNGLLVTPGDRAALAHAIRAVVTDRNLATRLGATGREVFLDRFSTGGVVDRLTEVYRQAIDDRSGR